MRLVNYDIAGISIIQGVSCGSFSIWFRPLLCVYVYFRLMKIKFLHLVKYSNIAPCCRYIFVLDVKKCQLLVKEHVLECSGKHLIISRDLGYRATGPIFIYLEILGSNEFKLFCSSVLMHHHVEITYVAFLQNRYFTWVLLTSVSNIKNCK